MIQISKLVRHVQSTLSDNREDRIPVILLVTVLAFHAVQLGYGIAENSPTLNEPAHLAAGINAWERARFDLYRVDPPLPRMIAALPVMVSGIQSDWSREVHGSARRPEFAVGMDLVRANGMDCVRLFQIGRLAMVPISIIGAVTAFLFARDLYRSGYCGLLAATLWCLSPSVLAHVPLITPDGAAMSFGLLSQYRFWIWIERTGWLRSFAAGGALGLAALSRTSWLLLFGVYFVLWMAVVLRLVYIKRTDGIGTRTLQMCGCLCVAILIVNAVYLFDGTCCSLGEYDFRSRELTNLKSICKDGAVGRLIARMPIPLPRDYVIGIDEQFEELELVSDPSYLRGEWRQPGWWYYYLYGCLVKIPHGMQILFGIAVFGTIAAGCRALRSSSTGGNLEWQNDATGVERREEFSSADSTILGELILIVPVINIFVLVSSRTELNHHFRYVLPVVCAGFVFSGKVVAFISRSSGARGMRIGLTAIVVTSLLHLTWSVLSVHPHCLVYFNELAGGPECGHRHLAHSSLDWCQVSLKGVKELKCEVVPLYELNLVAPLLIGDKRDHVSNSEKCWIVSRTTALKLLSQQMHSSQVDRLVARAIREYGYYDYRIPTVIVIPSDATFLRECGL